MSTDKSLPVEQPKFEACWLGPSLCFQLVQNQTYPAPLGENAASPLGQGVAALQHPGSAGLIRAKFEHVLDTWVRKAGDGFLSFLLYFLMENKIAKFSEMQYKSCHLNFPQEFHTCSRRAVTWLCRAHVRGDLLLAQLELFAAKGIKELGRAPQVRFSSCWGGGGRGDSGGTL